MPTLRCPRCSAELVAEQAGAGRVHRCPTSCGVSVNSAVLRQFAPTDRVHELWNHLGAGHPGAPCPSCTKPLLVATVTCGGRAVEIDACRTCQSLWFDKDELEKFAPDGQDPTRARTQPPRPGVARSIASAGMTEEERARIAAAESSVGMAALMSFTDHLRRGSRGDRPFIP